MSNLETGSARDVETDLPPGSAPVVDAVEDPVEEPVEEPVVDAAPPLDLDLIERDLRDVETTLARLADGTYFADAGPSTTDPELAP
jgi:hypothetical protein